PLWWESAKRALMSARARVSGMSAAVITLCSPGRRGTAPRQARPTPIRGHAVRRIRRMQGNSMAKIIVAAPPIPGELAPLLQLGRERAARGHRITMLTGSGFEDAVRKAGLEFVPLRGAADFKIEEFVALPERQAAAPGPEQLNVDWINAFVNPMP